MWDSESTDSTIKGDTLNLTIERCVPIMWNVVHTQVRIVRRMK